MNRFYPPCTRMIQQATLLAFILTLSANLLHGQESSVGLALRSVFDPQRAVERRTMGLMQRSFLDLVEESRPKLQIALVIDGTDSMDSSLEGVRNTFEKMAEDLRRYKDEVSFQVVVYRDIDAKSGIVSFPLNVKDYQFTPNSSVVRDGLETIEPESGAPFFHELVDVGVHEALTKLNWSRDPDTTRWILIFGDAPPFDETWTDAKTNSHRHVATQRLITLARNRNVRVSSVLCESRSKEKTAYDKSLRETRRFFNTLANETDGLMLDLSYESIRDALVNASKKQTQRYQEKPIPKISKSDIQVYRDRANRDKLLISDDQQTRIAILPYMPLDKVSFDPDRQEVQFAAELRYKFRQIPGVTVKSPRQIERVFQPLVDAGFQDKKLLMALASKLRVDYVLWGRLEQANKNVRITPVVLNREKGTTVAVSALRMQPKQSTAGVLASRVLRAVTVPTDELLARLERNQESLFTPVAATLDTVNPLMGAFDAMEQCLAYSVGSKESNELASKAKKHLDTVLNKTDDNALAHYLAANYHFNRAQAEIKTGNDDAASESMQQFKRSLLSAYKYRNFQSSNDLVTEIKGLHALLIKKDVETAISEFESLVENNEETRYQSARRAHWVLAGIYAGDWGVDRKWVNADKMRDHLLQILSFFESSPEADFIRNGLRWDPEKGETEFHYLPLTNDKLSQMIDA